MMTKLALIGAMLGLATAPAAAQDFGSMASDSLSSAGSFAGTVGVNSHVGSKRERPAVNRETRVACASKERIAARLPAEKGRRLYALCRSLGR
jgi:hypothetical protein